MKNALTSERKLYQDLKKNTPSIIWNRIENLSLLGMPDLLGYNNNQHFFTVELKVAKGNKVRFSPHQIAFHKSHPKKTYILLKPLGQRSLKLIPGSEIHELWSVGHGACLTLATSYSLLLTLSIFLVVFHLIFDGLH